jgi:hypothetical protein
LDTLPTPSFSERQEFTRYIGVENRLRDNRPAVAAFIDGPNEYLSVNALELERIRHIAKFYRLKLQNGTGPVAVVVRRIHQFIEAGKLSGVAVNFDRAKREWYYSHGGGARVAFKHRPNTNEPKSLSHCGVEFTTIMNEYAKTRFARRILGRARYQVVQPAP